MLVTRFLPTIDSRGKVLCIGFMQSAANHSECHVFSGGKDMQAGSRITRRSVPIAPDVYRNPLQAPQS